MNTGFLLDNSIVDWEYVGHTEVPPRSRLYCLEPVDVGTPMVESLTSYLCRLAAQHSVTPWMLVTRELAPLATTSTLRFAENTNGHPASCYAFQKGACSSLISNGRTSVDTTAVLEKLTMRQGLSSLTMQFTDGILSSRDLVSSHQQWCPQCFQSSLSAGKPVYLPLIWSLQHVKVCSIHKRELSRLCPHCEHGHPPLSRWLVPGYCPRCLTWMGDATESATAASDEDLATCQHVEQLLVDAPIIKAEGVGGWKRSVNWIIKNWFKHAEGFSRDIGVHASSVRGWLDGVLPSMKSVLSLSLQLRVSPSDLLLGNIGRLETLEPRSRLDLQPVGEVFKRHHLKHDINKLEELLKQAAASTETPPVSLASVARNAGVHISFASRKFPQLAGKIKSRYAWHRSRQMDEKTAHINTMVHDLVERMLAEGKIIGNSSFRKVLPVGYHFRDVRVIAAFKREVKLRNLKLNKSN